MSRKQTEAVEEVDLTQDDTDDEAVAAAAGCAAQVPPAKGQRKRGSRMQAQEAGGDDEAGASRARPSKPASKAPRQAAPAEPKRAKTAKKEPAAKRVDASGRAVRWLSKPSMKTSERAARAQPGSGHRLFLIDRKQLSPPGAEGGAAAEFAVLGATGNIYTVTISRFPGCTCPDSGRGNVCKHQLFVMLRVLRRPQSDPLVWQKALLPAEADAVLGGGPAAVGEGVLASQAVQEQYRRLSAGATGAELAAGRRPIAEDAECAVCQEPLSEGATAAGERVTFCASCGNNIHAQCIQLWVDARRAQGIAAGCPYCRSGWVDGLNPQGGGGGGGGGAYVNLAAASEAHRGADTSLEALYGDRSVWVRAGQGQISRGAAAAAWRSLHT